MRVSSTHHPLGVLSFATVMSLCLPARASGPNMTECLSANESAIRLRADHKLRQSREQSLICASSSCAAVVHDVCSKRAADISAAIPSVVLRIEDASGKVQAHVTLDGRPLADGLDAAAIELDPGEHTFYVTAPGKPPVEQRVMLSEGDRQRVIEIRMGAEPTQAPGRGHLGLMLSGAGLGSIVVGSVLGGLALSAWSSAKSDCGAGGPSACSPAGATSARLDYSRAETDGAVSTVFFVAGAALVASGGLLWWMETRPAHHETPQAIGLAPAFGPGQAGLVLGGVF